MRDLYFEHELEDQTEEEREYYILSENQVVYCRSEG